MIQSHQRMNYMKVSQISFYGKPANYAIIDKFVSRSAQPKKEDFIWLKEQGVTDIFNFRTMSVPNIDYDEKCEVEKLGMKYHNIPSITSKPTETNVNRFLSEIKVIVDRNGKAHIHCMAGADRTGMYSLIYKSLKGIGFWGFNVFEMLRRGHYYIKYPNIIPWAKQYIKKNKNSMTQLSK